MSSGVFDSNDSIFLGKILMTWYFEAIDGGTKVTVVAEKVPEGIKKEDHLAAGLNSSLEQLENFVGNKSL